MSGPFDFTAGDFHSCVAGRLGMKIVGAAVDDYRPADSFSGCQALGKKGAPGVTVVAKERRHISRMAGMRAVAGIQVRPGVGKGILCISGAGSSLVDMKAKDLLAAVPCAGGQTEHLRHH